ACLEKNCILLCDDFSAELDIQNQRLVLNQLHKLGLQLFVTLIDPKDLLEFLTPEQSNQLRLFHVKQGEIEPVSEPV
ncbi:MAG: hypothetical protein AAF195_00950, partial [Pseudomonadota bacterium]